MPLDPPESFIECPPVYSFPYAHNWTVGPGVWTFGINEVDLSGAPTEDFIPRTTVYVGPTQFSTSFSAYEVVAGGVLAALVIVAAVLHTVARFVGRSRPVS